MPLFKKAPPPKKPRRSHLPQTLDSALEKELIKRARKDPDWAFAAAKRKFNISGPEDENPIAKVQREALAEALQNDPEFIQQVKQNYLQKEGAVLEGDELDKRIGDASMELLESNPELLQKIARRRIDSMMSNQDGMSGMAEQLREFRQLEEELGGGKKEGLLGGLIDSSVMAEIIRALPALMGKGQSAPTTQDVYIVETPTGDMLRLTPGQYQEYRNRKALPPGSPQSLEQAPEDSAKSHDEASATSVPHSNGANQDGGIDISSWLPYLDQDPSVFVAKLRELLAQQDKNAIFTYNLLGNKTSQEIIAMLTPYKDKPELSEFVTKLEGKTDWIDQVILLIETGQEHLV